MKVAVIGAGCAGLVSARYCLKNNLSCNVFEQTGNIGGVWNYTDKTGLDDNGIPIHSVMYKDLRTNLPKELMSYFDFPYPENLKSYLTQPQVLSYMQRYAEHFDLLPCIKLYKQVIDVSPTDGKWKVTVLDVKTKTKELAEYDAVMVCNGHYHKISMPTIDGMETFDGVQMHSNLYRTPERFRGLKTVVIGAGPSGQDISSKISAVSEKVFLSHRFASAVHVSASVVQKPVVQKISGKEILFEDGTKENVDAIVYCTGYKYDFPFLSKECDITTDGAWIKHIYKHIINVQHSTMGFIGVCIQICPFPVCDVQVQYFLSCLLGRTALKSKAAMLENVNGHLNSLLVRGLRTNQMHKIAENQKDYCDDLAKSGNFKSLPPVLQDLYIYVRKTRNVQDCFKILDEQNFIKVEFEQQ